MIVSGLNGNRFLVGNPIPIKITFEDENSLTLPSRNSYAEISITKLATHPGDVSYTMPAIKLYKGSITSIEFDLAPYIKGLMPYMYAPDNSYQNPVPNYQNFNITFNHVFFGSNITTSAGIFSRVFLNKTFIKGYKREYNSEATTLPIGTMLSPTALIPKWQGYPIARFYINENSEIIPEVVVDNSYTKTMRVPTSCNPFYVRFANSLGGYSFWMFNSWEWTNKTKSAGELYQMLDNVSLGYSEENTVSCDTRVRREFYPLIRDLIASPMIQVYNKFSTTQWKRISINATSFTESNYEDLIEFNCTFNLNLKNNPQEVW